jgi:hypothetical protein
MEKRNLTLKIDNWSQVINCYDSAMYVRDLLLAGESVAIPLLAGNMTLFHMSFVPLSEAIPPVVAYSDGSGRGVQINIDRKASYSLPWHSAVGEGGYISTKWNIPRADADALLPFFNTVLTGKNHYVKKKNKR